MMQNKLRARTLFLLTAILQPSAWAVDAVSTPAPTLPDSIDWVAYYASVCGDVDHMVTMDPEQLAKLNLEAPVVQRVNYCTQAKMSQRGYHFGIISASTASAAAAVCTLNCIATQTPWTLATKGALDRACSAAGIGSSVVTMGLSIAMAKDFGGWLLSNIGNGVTFGKSIAALAKPKGTEASNAAGTAESCIGAGFMIIQAGVYSYQTGQARGPWGQALYQAGQLNAANKGGIVANERFGGPTSASGVNSVDPVNQNTTPVGGGATNTDSCATAVHTRSFVATTDCAKSMGTTLPDIYTPEFQDVFKQITHQDMTSFLKSGGDVASALEPSIGSSAASALRARQNQSVQLALANASAAQYASSGGARAGGRGGSKPSDPFADIAGLMKSMLPGGKKAPEASNTGGIQTYGGRGLASQSADLSNDPRVSLFDRVSTAYRTQSSRTGVAGQVDAWSLPINRASHGLK